MLNDTRCLFIVQLTILLVLSLAACEGDKYGDALPVSLDSPLPAFLNVVAPAPNSEYSIEAYNKGQHYPISEAHPASESED